MDSSTSDTHLNLWNGEFLKPECGQSLKEPAPTFLFYSHINQCFKTTGAVDVDISSTQKVGGSAHEEDKDDCSSVKTVSATKILEPMEVDRFVGMGILYFYVL